MKKAAPKPSRTLVLNKPAAMGVVTHNLIRFSLLETGFLKFQRSHCQCRDD